VTAHFDTFVMVDWSGGNDRGPRPKKDAIWVGVVRADGVAPPVYLRNRQVAEDWLSTLFQTERRAARRVLVGFDFPFGYPTGVAAHVTGQADPFSLWHWLEARITDSPKANNRWQVAGEMNALFPGVGPFWGKLGHGEIEGLPRTKRALRGHGVKEWRQVETATSGTFSVWQLAYAGAVGSQVLMGLPVLARLRRRFGASVWPFEQPRGALVMAEIWPSLLNAEVRERCAETGGIRDAVQVALMARAFAGLDETDLAEMLSIRSAEEGWILGLGHEHRLRAAL